MSKINTRTSDHACGFSLIELMITVAVVGILAAVAYPSYTAYIVRSNRTAAQSYLMEIAEKQSQYLLDSRSYASSLDALSLTTPAKVASVYEISIVPNSNPPRFTASATPRSGTIQANDETLTIDNTGAKTPSAKW